MMQVTKVWWDGEKLMAEPIDPTTIYQEPAQPDSICSNTLRAEGKAYPRTCKKCELGPCVELAQQALDKMAGSKRELGIEMEPVKFKCTVVDDDHPKGVPLSQWGQQGRVTAAKIEQTFSVKSRNGLRISGGATSMGGGCIPVNVPMNSMDAANT